MSPNEEETTLRRAMRAARLHGESGVDDLVLEEVSTPVPAAGEVLVRVHAAAITRDELEWPVDRLPAIPSYEVSGVADAVDAGVDAIAVGDEVYGLTAFDRDGVAAEYATVPAHLLAPKPSSLTHVESAAIPMAALSAWQGLFDHGELAAGQRVLVVGAAGGVGHIATQLARARGASVSGTASSSDGLERVRELGADEAVDSRERFEESLAPVDLVFDTVGGELLERSAAVLRSGGRLVSIAEEPRPTRADVTATYFVVEPRGDQLAEITPMIEAGTLQPAIDSVFGLEDAQKAFGRVQEPGKRGKVVLEIR